MAKRLLLCLAICIAFPLTAAAQNAAGGKKSPEGEQLFKKRCASCHTMFNPVHAPWPTALHHMSRAAILAALEKGIMRTQASGLSRQEMTAIAEFLGEAEATAGAVPDRCPGAPGKLTGPVLWNGWGVDNDNSREQSARTAGLSKAEVPKLKLKWAFGIPGAASAGTEPTLIGERLFFGGGDGVIYSLNAKSGCVEWTYKAPAPPRTPIVIGPEKHLAYFGDTQGSVYALNASTGAMVWKVSLDPHPFTMITGTPKVYEGRLFVPVSSAEEVAPPDPHYACCTFRGSMTALDAKTGKLLWRTYTIPTPPMRTGKNAAGAETFGPSGAAIWCSPTLDPAHHALYVGTGDNYSNPGTAMSDAVVAFNLDTGKILWSRQLTAGDSWNIACESKDKTNCPKNPGKDFDIGASPILRRMANGKRVLVVGQKSGIVYGLDPDRKGAILWQTRIGKGSSLGGVEFGGAAGRTTAYIPLSDYSSDPLSGGGLFALDVATGKKIWHAAPPRPACLKVNGCSAAQEGPATLIPGTILLGSLDGHLRAYDERNGAVIWDFDALRSYKTVNGVKASGGSFSHAGPIAGLGMVFVESGYAINAGIPGNVLLAFSVDGK